jgi:choline dehydrogenase
VAGPLRSADFIVVGAGSAGCAATARLVGRGARVLLVEAGGPDTNPAIGDVSRAHELWHSPDDWDFFTVPQPGAADRRLHLPRGRVLGGSSSLNGAIHVRGAPADYDHWAYLGNAGWRWADVKPIFERMEDRDLEPSGGAPRGPVKVVSKYRRAPIHQSIVAAAQEVGIPFNSNYNGETQDGVSFAQFNIAGTRRQSAAGAYLDPILGHRSLQVLTGAVVNRLVFEDSRCVGVEWSEHGAVTTGRAESGVILAAGVIGSPRILLLSGIGAAGELRGVGVNVKVDLPGVGRNLHDHLLVPVISGARRQIEPPSADCLPIQTHLFWRSRPGLIAPDIQPVNFSVPLYEPWMQGPPNGFSLMAGMIRPISRGSVRLRDSDPSSDVLIDPRILSCEADLQALESSVVLCRAIAAAPALREWGAEEIYPGPGVQDPVELRSYVRRTAITYHHQVGTCKMGADDQSVVDNRLAVHGLVGLWVADASIMPSITSGNTNAPSMMIGERVGDFAADR